MSQSFDLLADGHVHALTGTRDGDRFAVDAAALEATLGWHVEAQGMCQGDVCVPIPDREALVSNGRLDLQAFADTLGCPLALDVDAGAAALGVPASDRAAQLETLEAPDFELPDLSGNLHRLSSHRGRKVLLVAYASW